MSVLTFAPVALSAVAIFVSFYAFRMTHWTSLRPILIFANIRREGPGHRWIVENVGQGPAINIILCCANHDCRWKDEENTLMPALPVGQQIALGFFSRAGAFCAIYSDVAGYHYTTVCMDNSNKITTRNLYPDVSHKRGYYQVIDAGR